MKSRKIILAAAMMVVAVMAAACAPNASNNTAPASKNETSQSEPSKKEPVTNETKGEHYTKLLAKTNWQGTKVTDGKGNDLTKENMGFIGLAKYDADSGYYEFFDKTTGETRGDEGTYFVTNDGAKRILISATKKYQAIVDITELNDKIFTYKRMGKDAQGKDVEVYVEHVPYTEKQLEFTKGRGKLEAKTGEIETAVKGNDILGKTLWNGTIVKDKDGNDLTSQNQMFISIAKFDKDTNKYEFFDTKSGETKGDYGYFSVIANNKIRSHVSIGKNKYGAVLEITELNDSKFTYKRMGKDANGKKVEVFVEHQPYKGNLKPDFTF